MLKFIKYFHENGTQWSVSVYSPTPVGWGDNHTTRPRIYGDTIHVPTDGKWGGIEVAKEKGMSKGQVIVDGVSFDYEFLEASVERINAALNRFDEQQPALKPGQIVRTSKGIGIYTTAGYVDTGHTYVNPAEEMITPVTGHVVNGFLELRDAAKQQRTSEGWTAEGEYVHGRDLGDESDWGGWGV